MKTKLFHGRYLWAAVGLAALAAAAAGVASAKPGAGERGYLGVYMQALSSEIRDGLDLKVESGVLISGVEEGSPAEKGGIEDGDVVVEFNGAEVASPDELRDLVRETKPGDKAEVVVIRDGDRKTIELVVGESPEGVSFGWNQDTPPGAMRWFDGDGVHGLKTFFGGPRLGVNAVELNDDLAGYFDAKAGQGVLVLEVGDESIAHKAGIKAGDVIEKVEDNAIGTVDELREAIRDYKEGDEFAVAVMRKGKKQTLKATMDDQQDISFFNGDDGHFRFQQFKGHPGKKRVEVSPRVRVHVDQDDVDDALDELRDEIKELKKELRELKKDS